MPWVERAREVLTKYDMKRSCRFGRLDKRRIFIAPREKHLILAYIGRRIEKIDLDRKTTKNHLS